MNTVLSLWRGEIPSAPPRRLMRHIAEEVAAKYDLTVEYMTGPSRRREVCWPRQEAMAECYQTGHFSLPQIGRYFGDRDHTTVLHAIRRVRDRDAAAK